ncbi:hypothetical protein JH314_08170 [Xanthomonas campestris]|uniref:hypothetical protein n=1 Tax=Xanthomonas campestris TaxID=339 RepID=UPI002367EE6F|nr:hypothetical protein [Xanthomonas campestris]MEB1025984.1 hypothetical protein [Xanthomonas campestris pv. campestris]WDJ03366.1 hypothetical protein JH314_08170 [Xanthomonas campestris]
MKKTALVVCIALLAACATKPVSDQTAVQAPADRVFAHQTQVANGATLIVSRDAGFAGSGCSVAVMIDGEKAAVLKPGERATFNLSGPEVILGAQATGGGICGVAPERMRRETSVLLPAGSKKKYRIGIGGSGEPFVAPTTL